MKKNKGQGLIEYIALTALVAIVSIGAIRLLGGKVQKYLNRVSGNFEHNLQVGLKYNSNKETKLESSGDSDSSSKGILDF